MRAPVLAASFLIVFTHGASALEPTDAAWRGPAAVQEEVGPPTPAERGPVAVPEPSEQAIRYYRSGNVVWGLLIPALFLFTGLSARIREWARAIGRKWLFVIAVYFTIFLAINFVIDFPLDYYQGFVRQHAYGLSNGMVVGALFLWIPYLLIKRSPRRWWLYTGLATIPFIFFMLLVSPIWIAPLFNDFGPMQDKALESKILALAERAGIEGGRVYEVNKSVDTEAVNAYVTGFLGTRRIILWDTMIAKFEGDELLFVMGHEMAHYVLRHAIKWVFFLSLLILLALYVVHRTTGAVIDRFKGRFRFDQLADIASLPLLILLLNLLALVGGPVAFASSRHFERQSDRFGLEITQDNHAAASAFVKLQHENLGVPRPGTLYKLWRATHPTLGERIDFCNSYRPWETGEPLEYGHLFADI